MKKILYGCCLLSCLCGCATSEKASLNIEGERISVVRENKNLTPDARGEKIKLPRAKINNSWTHYGVNANHGGGHLKAGGNLDEIWNENFGEGTSKRNILISSPVSDGKNIYTIDAKGKVKAFGLNDGKEIWERKLKPANKKAKTSSLTGAGLALNDDVLYASTGFGVVFAINTNDGSVAWEQNVKSPIRSAPTADGDLVIVQTIDNGIFALKNNDGSILWKDKIEDEATTMTGRASPAYSAKDDLVVAAFSNGQLQAYKASTGTPLWMEWIISASSTESLADITSIKANPIIDNGVVYAVGYNSPMMAIDARTGARIWQREIASASQPWLAGKYLFVLTNDGDLIALNKITGGIVWNTIIPYASPDERLGVTTSGPILANDALLVVSSNGNLYSVSPYSGRIMGVADVDKGIDIAPVMINETLLLTTNGADLIAFR